MLINEYKDIMYDKLMTNNTITYYANSSIK
jgi:hypothetical protein